MNASAIWTELESSDVSGPGWLRRRVAADSTQDIHLELAMPERRRLISLTLPGDVPIDADKLPETRGLEHKLLIAPGIKTLSLELTDPAAADLFGVLAEDLIWVAADAADPKTAAEVWIGRVGRWKRLFRRGNEGLSPDYQRGLFAELCVIQELLEPAVGIASAVSSWFGPDRSRHDFQLPVTSLEVKSCAANQPQEVTISSERQLDDIGTPSLHLVYMSLDVHHNGPESLPEVVAAVRAQAAGSGVEALFEDRLLESGYLDLHAPRYAGTGYTLRDCRGFEVRDGFPRIVESDLPEGVGNLRYRLEISACADFEVEQSALAKLIGAEG
jgi:Putative  PD-(D/E)XK family member, (DUF4420)